MTKIKIGDFEINNDSPVFIIAELSANHNGSLDIALETVRAAKRAGADCIKLQTYTPDTITLDSRNSDFYIEDTIWNGRYMYDLYNEAYTPWEWHKQIFSLAKELNLVCFSSPFDKSSVDFLEDLGVPAYKIASFEINDIPLIKYAASKGKPIIISTGVATEEDIALAIETCHNVDNYHVILLKCTSSYPSPISEANMIMLNDYKARYNVFVGLSDHSLGNIVPNVATCFGAKIIEKHLILDKSIGGPDSAFSLDEKEFSEMVKSVRLTEMAIGRVDYKLSEKQLLSRKFMRSLYVVEDIKKGAKISENNVKSIRPGFGIHPKYLEYILGKVVDKNLKRGDRFLLDYLEI